jgi:hypothetical protein
MTADIVMCCPFRFLKFTFFMLANSLGSGAIEVISERRNAEEDCTAECAMRKASPTARRLHGLVRRSPAPGVPGAAESRGRPRGGGEPAPLPHPAYSALGAASIRGDPRR